MKKRADGRYRSKIYLGMKDGKKKYEYVYGYTQAEVKEKIAVLKTNMGKGLDVMESKQTFQQWVDIFLVREKTKLTPHAYNVKVSYLKNFTNAFGEEPIHSIKPYQVEMVLQQIALCNPYSHQTSSAKTLKEYRNTCGQVFKYAINNRAITFNPCEHCEIPAIGNKPVERRALEDYERQWIHELTCYAKLPALISLYSGLRMGEMAALKWNNVDLVKKTITVCESYDFNNKVTKSPKTKAGYRTVPIPDILYNVLINTPKTSIFVVSLDGGQTTSNDWRKMMRDILVEIEKNHGAGDVKVKSKGIYKKLITIEPFGWHHLRHTYATMLYESGVDIYSAKELLGHRNIETTLAIYTHLTQTQKEKSIGLLTEYLNRGLLGVKENS